LSSLDVTEPASKPRYSEWATTRRQILVIEDHPLHRDLITRVVNRAGFETDTAENGEEGWEALCRVQYALAIIDHEIPKLKGLDLIERLRAVSAYTPCILISVSLPAPVPILKERVRPGDVLSKPFTIAQLVETIFRLLGEGRSGSVGPWGTRTLS
jgi:CheY-like chemotaxis protein